MSRRPIASLVAIAMCLSASLAVADTIATLHAHASGPSSGDAVSRVQSAVASALDAIGDHRVDEAQVTAIEGKPDAALDTSAGLVAVGKKTGADWVVATSVSSSVGPIHVELTACQVSSGRVESVSRDLDPAIDPTAQLKEMFVFLLRAEGIGDDPIPWEAASTKPDARPTTGVVGTAPSADATTAPPPRPPPPPGIDWNDHHRASFGAGLGEMVTLSRPGTASGSHISGDWTLEGAYALTPDAQVEATATLGGLYGPGGAIYGNVGARYIQPLTTSIGFRLGVGVGFFASTSSSDTTRLSLAFSPALVIRLVDPIFLDLVPIDLLYNTGSDPLIFLGARAMIGARF